MTNTISSEFAPPRDGELPDYLTETYTWAYLTPAMAAFFDHQPIVEAILWGNGGRLTNLVLDEIQPGSRVMQPAAVYGVFSRRLAERVGPEGRLEVRDVAPLQLEHTRRKLAGMPQASLRRHDACEPSGSFDAVACFFLLHEVPDQVKQQVVRAMLKSVAPGGKAIFVDYHRPHPLHPLKAITWSVFRTLEPFARAMWDLKISELAGPEGRDFEWSTVTRFGGLFQKTVAVRRAEADV